MRVLTVLWVVMAFCGCDCGASEAEEPEVVSAEAVKKELPKAVIEGVVRLAPGYTLPEYTVEQMEAKVLSHTTRAPWPQECTPPKNADRQPVRLTDDGALGGVVLAASEFKSGRSRGPVTHELSITDCRLTPQLVVAVKGDTVRLTNNVDYAFMPSFGKEAMARTLIKGQTQDFPLTKPGVFPLRCGFTAPCGRAEIMVMLHPIATISGANGRFRIEDVPADQPFVLSAWHPLFDEAKIDVKVAPGETRQVELLLTPAGQTPADQPKAEGADGPPGEAEAANKRADAVKAPH